jgi:hypothetical protein
VFESGRAPLVRAWDSRGFIRSPGPTKYASQEVRFSRIKKKSFETRREFERETTQGGSESFCDDNECLMDTFLSQYFSF